jgi:uncharacterized protein (DUF58 family)
MEQKPVVRIRLNLPWLRVLLAILVLLQLLDPNKAWMMLIIGFGGLWLLMYLWSRQLAAGLRILRDQLYGWLQVGDWLEERFVLSNQSLLPAVWVSIEDASDLPGYSVSTGTGIGGGAERRWLKRTSCRRRGEYHLGPLILKTGDIFGVYNVEVDYQETETFVVAPPVINLPVDIQIISGRRVDETRLSRFQTEKSISTIMAREYMPGDSFSKVHWMITAKMDEPYVRVFENIHTSNSWWVILDLDADAQIGEGDQATDEHGIILAASLTDMGLKTSKSVGLIAFDEEMVIHRSRHGFNHRTDILRSLALARRGSVTLADLLVRSERFLQQHSNIIVITSSCQSDWIDELGYLRKKGITPTVLLVAADESGHVNRLTEVGHMLAQRGISQHMILPELFDTPEAQPGKRGEIKWKFTPLGRAIMIRSDEGGV